ncbi:MAG: DUF5723 family protein [Bacteroidales bacterium]|nr:DUF5723 family protein [Bacteroidales bacterium]
MKSRYKLTHFAISATLWIIGVAAIAQSTATKTSYFLNNSYYRGELNPALQPERGYLNIFGIGNSTFNLDAGNITLDRIVYFKPDGTMDFTVNDPTERKRFLDALEPTNRLQADVSIQPFGMGFYTGKVFWTLNVGVKERMLMQAPKEFFEMILNGPAQGVTSMKNAKISNISYLDADLGISFPITKYVTVGGKYKYIKGLQYLDVAFDQFDLTMNQNEWKLDMQGKLRSSMTGYQGQVGGRFDASLYGDGIKSGIKNPAGSGYGIDLGIVVKPIEALSLSFAVIDLGSINWSKDANTFSDITYSQVLLDNKLNVNDQMNNLPEPEMTNVSAEDFSTDLPTAYNAGIEYSFFKDRISFGLLSTHQSGDYKSSDMTYSANLKPMKSFNTAVSYTSSSRGFSSYGAAVSWTPSWFLGFFVATDYMVSKVTPEYIPINSGQANIQFGVNIALAAKRKDKKKISVNSAPMPIETIPTELKQDTIRTNPTQLDDKVIKSDTVVFVPQVDSISQIATDSIGSVTRIDDSTIKVIESAVTTPNSESNDTPAKAIPENNSNEGILKPE